MKKRKKMPLPTKRTPRAEAVPAKRIQNATDVHDAPRETRSVTIEVEHVGERYRGVLRDGFVDVLVREASDAWVALGRGRWVRSDEWQIGDIENPLDRSESRRAPSGEDETHWDRGQHDDEDVIEPDVLDALTRALKVRLYPVVRCRTLATGETTVIGAEARVVYKRPADVARLGTRSLIPEGELRMMRSFLAVDAGFRPMDTFLVQHAVGADWYVSEIVSVEPHDGDTDL